MRTRKWLAGVGVGLFVLAGAIVTVPFASAALQDATPSPQEQTGENEDDNGESGLVGTPIFQPDIDLIRAQEIALTGQTGAAVTEVELEGEDGVLVYEVTLDNGTEVEIDATSGEVLETEQDDDGDDDEENEEEGEN